MLAFSAISTSPITSAVAATKAEAAIRGLRPLYGVIMSGKLVEQADGKSQLSTCGVSASTRGKLLVFGIRGMAALKVGARSTEESALVLAKTSAAHRTNSSLRCYIGAA